MRQCARATDVAGASDVQPITINIRTSRATAAPTIPQLPALTPPLHGLIMACPPDCQLPPTVIPLATLSNPAALVGPNRSPARLPTQPARIFPGRSRRGTPVPSWVAQPTPLVSPRSAGCCSVSTVPAWRASREPPELFGNGPAELVVKGVVGQGKCPGKCSAKMSLRYAAMVSDVDGLGTIRCFHPGGPPASR